MIESSTAIPRPVALAARPLRWRVSPALAFVAIVVGLAVLAGFAQVGTRPLVLGLPDDPGLRAATAIMRGRTLPDLGPLRMRAEVLGDGAVAGAFPSLEQLRAGRALELAAGARARHGWDPRYSATLGALHLVRGEWRAAERAYRAAIDRAFDYGEARLGLGVTLAARAGIAPQPLAPRALELAALAQFAAVPERDPCYEAALWNRASLLWRVDRPDEARWITARYLARDPSSAWARELRGTAQAAGATN